jgi:hypothetical protein
MPKQSLATLKNWFKQGLKPLENQFHDWMDSFWHQDQSIPIDKITDLQNTLNNLASSASVTALDNAAEKVANKGQANGYASLDGAGKVPSGQLPSFVDDVLEFANLSAFPALGETGKIFVAIDTNLSYRWSGAAYILISSAPSDASETVKGIGEIASKTEAETALGLEADRNHTAFLTARGFRWAFDVMDFGSKIQTLFINWLTGVESRSNAESAYTLHKDHAGRVIRITNPNAVTVTIPDDGVINCQVGTRWIIRQAAAGVVTIVGAGGVTVETPDGFNKIRGINTEVYIVKIAPNTYTLLAPVVDRHCIMVTDFGAKGDGAFDNHAIIQALITAYPGKRIIIPSEGVFLIKKRLKAVTNTILNVYGELFLAAANIRSLTSDASIGQSVLNVANADQYFSIDDDIVISDNNQPVNGGGAHKTRKVGHGNNVTNVSSTQLTLRTPLIGNFTVAASAQVGQAHSVILADNVNNVKIFGGGCGIINGNRANQFNVAPLHESGITEGESVRQHCGIAAHTVTGLEVEGIIVKNSALHGVSYKLVNNGTLRKFYIENTMDKSFLGFNFVDGEVSQGKCIGSVDEDGITLYGGNSRILVSNVRAENCRRYGFTVVGSAGLNTNTDIQFVQIHAHACVTGIYLQNANHGTVTVDGFWATGNHANQNIPVIVSNCQNLTLFNVNVDGVTSAGGAISVANTSKEIRFIGGSVMNMPTKYAFSTDCQNVTWDAFQVRDVGSIVNAATSTTFIRNSMLNGYTSVFGNGVNATLARFIKCKGDTFKSTNASTVTIPSGKTFVIVNHGIAFTPLMSNLRITPTNNLSSASHWWISYLDENVFRINVDVDPGVGGATFAWNVDDGFEDSVSAEPVYTAGYTSDFSAGIDGWSATRVVATGNTDGVDGENDVLRTYADNNNNTHTIGRNIFQVGSTNRLTFRYRLPSGQTNVTGIRIQANATTLDLFFKGPGTGIVNNQWIEVTTKEFVATSAGVLIYLLKGSTAAYAGANSSSDDIIDWKDFRVEYR